MVCDCCGKQLAYGEIYFEIDAENICEDCLRDNYSYVNTEEPEVEEEGDPRGEPEYWEDR